MVVGPRRMRTYVHVLPTYLPTWRDSPSSYSSPPSIIIIMAVVAVLALVLLMSTLIIAAAAAAAALVVLVLVLAPIEEVEGSSRREVDRSCSKAIMDLRALIVGGRNMDGWIDGQVCTGGRRQQ